MNIFCRRIPAVFLSFAFVFSIGGSTVFGKGNFNLKEIKKEIKVRIFDNKEIKVRIFDNAKNTLTDKETDEYGSGMDIFLSVIIQISPNCFGKTAPRDFATKIYVLHEPRFY